MFSEICTVVGIRFRRFGIKYGKGVLTSRFSGQACAGDGIIASRDGSEGLELPQPFRRAGVVEDRFQGFTQKISIFSKAGKYRAGFFFRSE